MKVRFKTLEQIESTKGVHGVRGGWRCVYYDGSFCHDRMIAEMGGKLIEVAPSIGDDYRYMTAYNSRGDNCAPWYIADWMITKDIIEEKQYLLNLEDSV